MNKKLVTLVIMFALIILSAFSGYFAYSIINKPETNKTDNQDMIVSTIIMDINPSIEINLNKDEKIVSVKPLNEDAKEIVTESYKGKTLDDTVKDLTDNLIEKGYTKENVVILLEVKGEIEQKSVEKVIDNTLEEKKINHDIIIQELNEEAKENAIKYGITESKASYIEEIIKEKKDLSFEELKDKSISELKKIKNEKEEIVEDLKGDEEETTKSTEKETKEETKESSKNNSSSSSNTSQKSNKPKVSCNPPGAATEKIAEWCTYNKSRPQNCDFNYPEMLSHSKIREMALSHLGVSPFDTIGDYLSQKVDSRSSYCISLFSIITTKTKRTTITFDSVTGNIIEETSEVVPTPTISEEEAAKILLNHYGLKMEDCKMYNARFSTNNEGSPNWYYRYDTSITMNDGTQHLANINPFTGEIIKNIY